MDLECGPLAFGRTTAAAKACSRAPGPILRNEDIGCVGDGAQARAVAPMTSTAKNGVADTPLVDPMTDCPLSICAFIASIYSVD
jgi:hypothetical protein